MSKKEERGDSGPTSTVLADIRSFLNHVVSSPSPSVKAQSSESLPLFLMGHSMGGGEVLLLSLLQSQPQSIPRISGILLQAPYIALHPSAQPAKLTVLGGKLASKILPKHQLVQKLDSKYLCRHPQVCRDWENDGLCHDTGTFEGLAGMLQRAADLTATAKGQTVQGVGLRTVFGIDQPESGSVPIWISHGTEDRVTSCLLSQTMFDKLDVPDKTIKLYDGAYHKLHAEPDGLAEDFANDVATWVLERTSPESQETEDADDMRPRL